MTEEPTIEYEILGARGGCPVSGSAFQQYGGDTTCFVVETPDVLLVFDAGTGIRTLERRIRAWKNPKPIAVFFTHFHLDHTSALALFSPLYDPGLSIDFYGMDPGPEHPWRDALHHLMHEPYWPIALADVPANLTFHDLEIGAPPIRKHGVRVRWFPVRHTQTCLAYRIDLPGGSIVFTPDQELPLESGENYVAFARGADLLIQDAQYTPDEYVSRQGWGHSTWEAAASLAHRAEVSDLLLFHHDPNRTDAEIETLVTQARTVFPRTRAAAAGLRGVLPRST